MPNTISPQCSLSYNPFSPSFPTPFPIDWCAAELKKEHGCLEVPPDPQAACQVKSVDRKGDLGAVTRVKDACPRWVAICAYWNLICDPAPNPAKVEVLQLPNVPWMCPFAQNQKEKQEHNRRLFNLAPRKRKGKH